MTGRVDIPASRLNTIAPGPFRPDEASFRREYQFPDWLRDAKFGIWAHWGPQCVGGVGDHYAARLYREEDPAHIRHVQTYGHPSQFGFKEVCRAWRAEQWNPEALMALYHKAGARFFFCLANHHDNFDNFQSTYQPWNSVRIGPRKDVVGLWAAAARAHGLRFGVSVHAWQAWNYYAPARGCDREGSMAGVPYDGRLTHAQGRGQWWEGLDPQDLYAQNHAPNAPESRAYTLRFCLRVKNLVDAYRPDLLYFDNYDRSAYGGSWMLKVIAHYYNRGMRNGRCDVVFTRKHIPASFRGGMLWDVERGLLNGIQPHPWQMDTCIGHWHYEYGLKYRPVGQILHLLMDVVSKNGNLLLNIPLKGEGSLDPYERTILEDLARWFAVNGEAVYGTRPWTIFGEGLPPDPEDANYSWNEEQKVARLPGQIRFTTRGPHLYATLLGRPARDRLIIRTLARKNGQGVIRQVALLGFSGRVRWTHTAAGLCVILPASSGSDHTVSIRITGSGLRPV